MSKVLRISEAASLAMHTAVFLAAKQGRPVTVAEVAETLHASPAHLSKVLQRLAKAGIAQSVRGPHGGFTLARPADSVTLMEVYEVIEGTFTDSDCLLGSPVCQGDNCILGCLLQNINQTVRHYLAGKRLSDLTRVYQPAYATKENLL